MTNYQLVQKKISAWTQGPLFLSWVNAVGYNSVSDPYNSVSDPPLQHISRFVM